MLVIDASAAIPLLVAERWDEVEDELIAPPLLWSEIVAALRAAAWRGEISIEEEGRWVSDVTAVPVRRAIPKDLYARADDIAQSLGWAKTYDAEYVALAAIEKVPLLTQDRKLQGTAQRLIEVQNL